MIIKWKPQRVLLITIISVSLKLSAQGVHTPQQVLDKMVSVMNRPEKPKPILVISETKENAIYLAGNRITLDKSILKICNSFEDKADDALSFLIGHELAHYYKSGSKIHYFMENNLEGQRKEDQELSADLAAQFFCYQAGYRPLEIIDQLIHQIYQDYGFKSDLEMKRIEYLQQARENVEKIIAPFNLNLYLILTGKTDYLEYSAEIYEYINNIYSSRETNNNLGAIYLKLAMYNLGKEMRFIYPVGIETESGIITKGAEFPSKSKVKIYLDKALEKFNIALRLDPDYVLANMNKATTLILQKRNILAFEQIKVAQKLAEKYRIKQLIKSTQLIEALAVYDSGNQIRGRQLIQKITDDELSRKNLAIMNGEEPLDNQGDEIFSDTRERIDGIHLEKYSYDFDEHTLVDEEYEIDTGEGYYLFLIREENQKLKKSEILILITPSSIIFVQVTNKDYTGVTARGIKLGDSLSKVQEVYGDYSQIFNLPTGIMIGYENAHIMFELNAQKKVVKWLNYYESKW